VIRRKLVPKNGVSDNSRQCKEVHVTCHTDNAFEAGDEWVEKFSGYKVSGFWRSVARLIARFVWHEAVNEEKFDICCWKLNSDFKEEMLCNVYDIM
jgi:hypothetical protein